MLRFGFAMCGNGDMFRKKYLENAPVAADISSIALLGQFHVLLSVQATRRHESRLVIENCSKLASTAIHCWLAETSRLRQMPNVEDHVPHIVVREDSARWWHAGRVNSVVDDPL